VDVDPLELLGERAALAGLARQGRTSCGGATRLLPTADGWLAVTLARPDDVATVPAWLGVEPDGVGTAVRRRATAELVDRAVLLGLPVAALPRGPVAAPRAGDLGELPVRAAVLGDAPPTASLDGATVLDLGVLWAGPLCGGLLAAAGATVVKGESVQRPDGARAGPAAFFALLNDGKQRLVLDLATPAGAAALRRAIACADVVLETSRPRALQQLGIDAVALVAGGGPRVWVSITGHGREGAGAVRVGFGDDAAVAGGLVAWEAGEPRFCADAIADPAGGLVAAAACLEALASGGRWLVDVALSGVAAALAGPTLPVPSGLAAAAPRARR
jgi:hypothetical protein